MKKKIKFAFHILVHPFDGFWDMKREKKGDLRVSLGIFALMIVTQILAKQITAFLFSPAKFAPQDVIFDINTYLLIFLVFCVSNWSVTTLMQGEGTFRDIVMMTGYACLPLVLIPLPVAILTNIAAYTEEVYINAALALAWLWFFALLLAGVHQYSLGKMAATLAVTVVAMIAVIFICLLFINLFTQLVSFVYSIYKELSLRT